MHRPRTLEICRWKAGMACAVLAFSFTQSTWAQNPIALPVATPDRPTLELEPVPAIQQTPLIAPVEMDQAPTWPDKTMREIKLDVRDNGKRTPEDRSKELSTFGGPANRPASNKVFAWAAPDIRYQPLYFEDVPLERYGQTLPAYRQSARSTLHFFKSFILLPHQMRHDPPGSCDYPLGFCRPGNEISYVLERKYFGRPR